MTDSAHTKDRFPALLRSSGFKVTPGRLALLKALAGEKPMNISEVTSVLRGTLDQATVYRALEAFANADLVKRVRIEAGQTHYEILAGGHHHHHLVCERCGKIEDVEDCETETLERQALKHSKSFASVRSHSLEFFGICKRCA